MNVDLISVTKPEIKGIKNYGLNLTNAINAYNNFMIFIVGYDIINKTCGDVNNIYGITHLNLITPFGKLPRKIIKNDPNVLVMTNAFNDKQQCFIFN